MEPRLVTCSLDRRDDLGGGYFVLGFACDAPLEALPGAFAMVRSVGWGVAPLLARPMSLLTSEPSILIKVIGEGTRRMAEAPLGERFTLLGPLGRPWTMPGDGELPLLVAGGVGVAPLVYLARALHERGREVKSLYGGRTARDLPLADELERCGPLGVTTEDGSRGTHGRVTLLLERELAEAQSEARGRPLRIYTCGPHAMMAAVAALARTHGVPCDASLEAPMGCGYGVCLGCPVARRDGGYLYCCVDGPCVDAAIIDWGAPVF